jgi:ABC-type transport system involved in multi-copper enzyme maturation permease subunit
MTWSIAKKEILENLTTYRFYVLIGLLSILMIVSIVVSYEDYTLRVENYNINRPGKNSANVMIPPTPVSIFAKGVDGSIGRLYYVSTLGIEGQSTDQSVNRLFSLFTVPDMLFIIKVMLSLIALLFSFDGITGEKESGTLKLTLTNGSPRTVLVFGKLLGRFILVFVPFFFLFLIAAVVVSLLPAIETNGYYWQRIGAMLVISTVYIAAFTSLGLLISSLVHRSSTSLILSLAMWVMFVFVIPELGSAVAASTADIPPSERVEMQKRLASIQAIYERGQREKAGVREQGQMVREIHDANSQVFDSYRPKLNALIRTTKNIVRFSPSGALTFLLSDVANTGVYEELRFKDAVKLYVDRNFDVIFDLAKGSVDPFHYERASLGEVLSQEALADIIVLLFFNLGFIGLTMGSFLRYDPR